MTAHDMRLRVSSDHVIKPFSDQSAAYVFTTSPPAVRILDELAWATLSIADGATIADVEQAFRDASPDEPAMPDRGRAITLSLIQQGILVEKEF